MHPSIDAIIVCIPHSFNLNDSIRTPSMIQCGHALTWATVHMPWKVWASQSSTACSEWLLAFHSLILFFNPSAGAGQAACFGAIHKILERYTYLAFISSLLWFIYSPYVHRSTVLLSFPSTPFGIFQFLFGIQSNSKICDWQQMPSLFKVSSC